MSNSKAESNTLVGRTCRNDYDGSTALSIPKEFAEKLKIENSKVLVSLIEDYDGANYLLINKLYKEILLN